MCVPNSPGPKRRELRGGTAISRSKLLAGSSEPLKVAVEGGPFQPP